MLSRTVYHIGFSEHAILTTVAFGNSSGFRHSHNSCKMSTTEDYLNVENLSKRFEWPEYLVFGSVLVASAGIGIFYGCFGTKQKTNEEFLMGNRNMSAFPVALSLLCSFISANTMIGNPVEIYYYGTQYMLSLISYVPLTLTLTYLYIPVYFKLQLTSAYEYFE
ncbi:unnamed protein product, partial [Allacma fusca]